MAGGWRVGLLAPRRAETAPVAAESLPGRRPPKRSFYALKRRFNKSSLGTGYGTVKLGKIGHRG
jgi:hypothetical protein